MGKNSGRNSSGFQHIWSRKLTGSSSMNFLRRKISELKVVGKKTADENNNRATNNHNIPPVPESFTPNFSLHSNEFRKRFDHPHNTQREEYGGEDGTTRGVANLKSDVTRLGAGLFTAVVLGVIIYNPLAGSNAVKKIANNTPLGGGHVERPCRLRGDVLTTDFTDFENVLSISPLGGVTAPGEILPAPYIRINTKNDGSPFQRRSTSVKMPANADIVAIERHLIKQGEGSKFKPSWTVHFIPCEGIQVAYERLDSLSPVLIERAGGVASFHEIGGPEHLAKEVSLKIEAGKAIGNGDGFNVTLHDENAESLEMARPERYRRNPYVRAEIFNVPASLMKIITPDHSKARCALDYLSPPDRKAWSSKLGDSWGIRRAKGENACRTALIDLKGTAQGAWYTDAAHNGNTTKISAIALAHDTINPDRLIFAFHGKLPSLTTSMIGNSSLAGLKKEATLLTNANQEGDHKYASNDLSSPLQGDFITFEKGSGTTNRSFDEVRDGELYCYDKMRVNFVGPKVRGIILMQKSLPENDQVHGMLKIEARDDILSCADLSPDFGEKDAFSEKATGFFR